MKEILTNDVKKELNWREKIITKMFKKTFNKVWKIGITYGFNNK